MGWPQLTYIALVALSGGYALARDGEPRENYSFGGWLVNATISVTLLWAGGFWG